MLCPFHSLTNIQLFQNFHRNNSISSSAFGSSDKTSDKVRGHGSPLFVHQCPAVILFFFCLLFPVPKLFLACRKSILLCTVRESTTFALFPTCSKICPSVNISWQKNGTQCSAYRVKKKTWEICILSLPMVQRWRGQRNGRKKYQARPSLREIPREPLRRRRAYNQVGGGGGKWKSAVLSTLGPIFFLRGYPTVDGKSRNDNGCCCLFRQDGNVISSAYLSVASCFLGIVAT